jgi:hypothetical protein
MRGLVITNSASFAGAAANLNQGDIAVSRKTKCTVKSHLSRLFEKTGGTRQADLVKIFAGYANPPLGSVPLISSK